MATIDEVTRALRLVIDPEVGINVVDLGLIYGIDLEPDTVNVRLAMTSPTCPLSGYLVDTASRSIARQVSDVGRVFVTLVDDPPWGPEMMSEEARRLLA
ncbi:MAG: metal-sulfur cluster assembly factor [Deltaproteobacteria bacterium]|nr:metal-sulfur cluster assembly factor [Deltaproteobacteria bacterium]